MIHFLVHDATDNVGVAVVDLEAGTDCAGRNLTDQSQLSAHTQQAIPLGHKLALKNLKAGEEAVKYGCVIGVVVKDIAAGNHVHVHNLKTKRWV